MKYLIEFNGSDSQINAVVESIGAHVVPTHPLRYAAMALDAKAVSSDCFSSPQDYLRQLAIEDALVFD